MGLSQGQLLSGRRGYYSKHWFLVSTECTSLAAKLTVQIVLVMNWRTLTWEVAFTVHSISPRPLWERCWGLFCLWLTSFLFFEPFLRVQQLHPDFFSLTLFFQFRNSCFWPLVISFIRDHFPQVVLHWARTSQLMSESARWPKHQFKPTCFQNTLFVYLTSVLPVLPSCSQLEGSVPKYLEQLYEMVLFRSKVWS